MSAKKHYTCGGTTTTKTTTATASRLYYILDDFSASENVRRKNIDDNNNSKNNNNDINIMTYTPHVSVILLKSPLATTVESPHNSMLARAPRNESSPGIRLRTSVAAPNQDGGDDTRATRATNKI